MLDTCTTPDPVTLIVSMAHLLRLLVRILPASYDRKPCFLHKPVEFQRFNKNRYGSQSHQSPSNQLSFIEQSSTAVQTVIRRKNGERKLPFFVFPLSRGGGGREWLPRLTPFLQQVSLRVIRLHYYMSTGFQKFPVYFSQSDRPCDSHGGEKDLSQTTSRQIR